MRIDLGPGRCIKPKSSYLPAPSLTAPQRDNMRKLKFVMVTLLIFVSLNSICAAASAMFYFDHVGWHFKSIPIHPYDSEISIREVVCDASKVDPSISGGCTEVYFYNSTDKKWYHWDKSKPDSQNTLVNITNGYGYWFYADKVGYTNSFKGLIIDPIDDLAWGRMQPGWNMMGWTNLDPLISNTIPQIEDKWGKEIVRVWHYDGNSLDLILDYWPDNDSAVFKGQVGYWDCVYDLNDSTFCEETAPPLMPWQNQWPELNETSVTRTRAEGIKFQYKYTFSVKYSDSDNDAPSTAIIYVDGVAHDMGEVQPTGEGGPPPNYIEGVMYEYKEILDFGEHTYSFEFDDGKGHTVYEPRGGNKNHTLDVKLPFAVAGPVLAKAWMIKEMYVDDGITCNEYTITLTGISATTTPNGTIYSASFEITDGTTTETGSIDEGDIGYYFQQKVKIKVADIEYSESLVVVHIQCE